MNFAFLFNGQVQFLNLYQNYFQTPYLLQAKAIFFNQFLSRSEQWILDWERYCELFLFFRFIHTAAIDKMEVEEMSDFFSQRITYEEIGAILPAMYPRVREYFINFATKKEFLPGSFKILCEQWFWSSCRGLK